MRIQLKLNTALFSTVRSSIRSCVTGMTSHISHIYKGIIAKLIIRGPIKPIKKINAESAVFTLSCFHLVSIRNHYVYVDLDRRIALKVHRLLPPELGLRLPKNIQNPVAGKAGDTRFEELYL